MIVSAEGSGFFHRATFCAEEILFDPFYNPSILCDFIHCNTEKESLYSAQSLQKLLLFLWMQGNKTETYWQKDPQVLALRVSL